MQPTHPSPGVVPPTAPAAHAVDMSHLNEQQRAALRQIMALTESQLNALPPAQRQQVLLLKASLLQRPVGS
jgi:hypothetical protein